MKSETSDPELQVLSLPQMRNKTYCNLFYCLSPRDRKKGLEKMCAPPVKEAFTCIQGVTQFDNCCLGELESAINPFVLAHIAASSINTWQWRRVTAMVEGAKGDCGFGSTYNILK